MSWSQKQAEASFSLSRPLGVTPLLRPDPLLGEWGQSDRTSGDGPQRSPPTGLCLVPGRRSRWFFLWVGTGVQPDAHRCPQGGAWLVASQQALRPGCGP